MTLPSIILMPLLSFSRNFESGQFDVGTGLYSYKNEFKIVNLYSGACAINEDNNLLFANGYVDIGGFLYFNNQSDFAIQFTDVTYYWLANNDVIFSYNQAVPQYVTFEGEYEFTNIENIHYSNSLNYYSNFILNTSWSADYDVQENAIRYLHIEMGYQNPDGNFDIFNIDSEDYLEDINDKSIIKSINGAVAINKDYLIRSINENILLLLDSNSSYITGFNEGYAEGDTRGYQRGYAIGFNEGFNSDTVATTIFNGILYIGLLPINVFLACFNFEILGINMSSFVTALLSVSFVVIIFRFLFNGKSGD